MPILPVEPNLFPTDLFETPATEGRVWWVLHTKPRQEKSLARDLLLAEIPFYLPLLERKVLVRGKFLQSYIPLFTSYVFLLADQEERVSALATKRVVQSLDVKGQAELWKDLNQVHRLITCGLPVTPEQRLCPGATVEIRTGALAGLKGTIIREAARNRFVVQVDFIQQGASVILDDYVLAAVSA
jgi:transcriptional antiterminator RfaH